MHSRAFAKLIERVRNKFVRTVLQDPTLLPPPGYMSARASAVYGEAFRRCFEFLSAQRIQGDIYEFGTFKGYTARHLATLMREFDTQGCLRLFDSFEGLPAIKDHADLLSYEVAITKVWAHHVMEVSPELPAIIRAKLSALLSEDRVHVTKGYFEDSLTGLQPTGKAALIHVDCDLYQSTKTVLDFLISRDLLQDGAVLLLDDFNCNRANDSMGERRAVLEMLSGQYQYRVSRWFSYGWHGEAMFIQDMKVKPVD